MRFGRRNIALLLALLFAAVPVRALAQAETPAAEPQTAAAATPPGPAKARIDFDLSKGYARILFTFQRPAAVSASVADSVLTIRSGAELNTTVDNFIEKLGPYVSSGRVDNDGLTYRFALKAPVALHNSAQGNKAVVDLVPDGFKGVPPDLPPPPPPPKPVPPDVSKLSQVKVRVGEYANFTRLVFDWEKQVPYTVYPGRGRISIRFDTLVRPDFSTIERRAPAWVKSAGWHIDGNSTVVDFDTDPESAFHDFRDGAKIAIDVLAPKTDASAYTPPRDAPGPAIPIPITPPPKPAPKSTPNPPPPGTDAANAFSNMPMPTPRPAAKMTEAPAPAQKLAASAEMTREGSVLHFPQAHGHAVAVFMRGDTLWIVLDNHPALDPASLLAPLSTSIVKADAVQAAGAAVLRIGFKTPLFASVSQSEVALNITLTARDATRPDPLAFTRQGDDGQTTLTTPLPGATRWLAISDPDAGDRLIVIPARPGKAMLTPKRFVELEALPSTAGMAVIPFIDDLTVRVQDETVTFARPQGLALSSSSGALGQPIVQVVGNKEGPAFIDFAQWGRNPEGTEFDALRKLRASVATLPESDSNRARLQLARYMLAHELAPETLGEIGMILSAEPKLSGDPGLQAMKGASQVMMGRYSDARMSLSAEQLVNDPHAAFWRSIAEAKLADYAGARRDFIASRSVLPLYPQNWQNRARLARAETGLAQGDLASTADALDQLPAELPPRDSVEARLYAAQLLAAQGHVNEAVARLRGLEQTDYPPVAAKAAYARVDTLLAAKKIKSEEAIDTLEKLRFRWRGDDLELKTLRKLGELYFADRSWREGLNTLRIAALNFPNTEQGRQAQDDMRTAFNDLFLGTKADAIPPVQALALFYDFTELTPIGRDGDEMIRRLSDRLVAVDLLGPAEQLLDHQVTQRLDGVARAAVATKLAVIYLLDHKPNEALKTLNDSRQTRLPDDITAQRRILEARALAGLKRYDAATDLIADDDSMDAKRLRADIYWESQNWPVAGAKMEEMLGERWTGNGALSDAEREMIMRAAVAYSLGGLDAKLAALRDHYSAKMNASPDGKSFAVVTEKIDRQGVAFQDLAKQIASVDTLQAFMAEFKKQGAAPPKTATN